VIIFSSCEKSVYISIPEESNKPVLNLLLNKDSVIMARVTLSDDFNNSLSMPEVTNADVSLYENGAFKEKLVWYGYSGRIFYRGNTLPKTGATYRVTVAVPGYTEVAGSDQIPDTVAVGEMRLTVAQPNSWETKATISVQLHDDPAVQNYYRVRIFTLSESVDANGNGRRQKSLQYFEVEEASLDIFNDQISSEFFTTDALFNGRSPRFLFRANTYSQFKKMIVEITSLTYNSYNYLNSAAMAAEKNEDGFSEKVIVFNNIENGLGIVGGVAQREYELER
jgi:hypothetical protein